MRNRRRTEGRRTDCELEINDPFRLPLFPLTRSVSVLHHLVSLWHLKVDARALDDKVRDVERLVTDKVVQRCRCYQHVYDREERRERRSGWE
jgi:hypothetical protein